MRKAIATAESVAPCILWIDELEKGFSGTQSSGMSDGGTTSRVFGSFINWLQDKKAACFVVATSNDVSQLPPEMMRKGRFDEIFFVDLPAAKERGEIFEIHLSKRKRDPKKFDIAKLANATVGYSGAEIESAVEAALFKSFGDGVRELTTEDVLEAATETVPLSVTMSEGIEKLRTWAETRAPRDLVGNGGDGAGPFLSVGSLLRRCKCRRSPPDDADATHSSVALRNGWTERRRRRRTDGAGRRAGTKDRDGSGADSAFDAEPGRGHAAPYARRRGRRNGRAGRGVRQLTSLLLPLQEQRIWICLPELYYAR